MHLSAASGSSAGGEDPEGGRGGAAAAATGDRPRKGDLVDVAIEGIDHRGNGLARRGGAVLRVRCGNPGAVVRARVLRRRGQAFDAGLVEVLEPGPHAAEARCPHAGVCGGCALPRLAYDEQLRQKRALVEESLHVAWSEADLDGVDALVGAMGDVAPAERLEGYRNKMDFTFGSRRFVLSDEPEAADASFALGLHVPRMHQKVLDVNHCAIAFEGASEIVRDVRALAREGGLSPWDLRKHEGLLRHLVLRRGVRTGETMVHLVTSERAADLVEPLVAALLERHPGITTVVQGVTDRLSAVAVADEQHVLHGPGHIEEVLAGLRFRISPHSFFQTNTEQAERLLATAAEVAGVTDGDVVYDLYCGAGTIGLCLGGSASRVVGFESVPSAVCDARENADRNAAEGRFAGTAAFHEGDVLETMAEAAGERRPDAVLVDPPRAGLHPKVPARIAALGAPRITVVSCNPRTGARDVAALVREGYRVTAIRPVDLFPHTPHVEVVFGLERDR